MAHSRKLPHPVAARNLALLPTPRPRRPAPPSSTSPTWSDRWARAAAGSYHSRPRLRGTQIDAEVTEAALGHTFARGDRERYAKIRKNPTLLSRDGIESGLAPLAGPLASIYQHCALPHLACYKEPHNKAIWLGQTATHCAMTTALNGRPAPPQNL